jgi:hypothetical protein
VLGGALKSLRLFDGEILLASKVLGIGYPHRPGTVNATAILM